MKLTLSQALRDERAQGMTEYAILLGTIALGAIVTLTALGSRIRSIFSNVSSNMNNIPTS